MRAELVIDLNEVGSVVGKALGRDGAVLPSLGKIAALWDLLGVEVAAMHVVAPGQSLRASGQPSFNELSATSWWETESVFLTDEAFDVHVVFSAVGEEGPVAQQSLVTTTALRRSDELANDDPDQVDGAAMVIVMTNAPEAQLAVSHARGVPVMLAGTATPTTDISHASLELEWMAMLANRFAPLALPDVELRHGQPRKRGKAICAPFDSTLGRDESAAVLPPLAESIVIHDPEHFSVDDDDADATPGASGIASVVTVLGLGERVHVETFNHEAETERRAETELIATMYRYANDHPNTPIIIASGRPCLVAVASDLDAYGLINERRFLRLCLPVRDSTFNEAGFDGQRMAPRVLLERSLSEPLFAEDDSSIHSVSLHESNVGHATSPTLVLFTNPHRARETTQEWRHSTGRRFLMLGPDVTEAVPADEPDGDFLPVSLGGSTDFALRRPDLHPGSIVEGVLDTNRQRWIVVSDPIERRAVARAVILRDDAFSVIDNAA